MYCYCNSASRLAMRVSFNGSGPRKDIDIVHMDYCAESVYSLLCN